MTRAFILAASLLVGCAPALTHFDDTGLDQVEPAPPPGPNLDAIDGQDTFARIAWASLDQTGAPPLVEWHREGCDGNPWAFQKATAGYCVSGVYYRGARFVSAAVMPTAHESAVCHEYQHFIDWRDLGMADVQHTGAAFQPGGAVEACEAAMTRAGW